MIATIVQNVALSLSRNLRLRMANRRIFVHGIEDRFDPATVDTRGKQHDRNSC